MKYKIYLFLLTGFIASHISAQPVVLKQLGKENMLFNNLPVEYYKGFLYTIDNTGALYKTELSTGDHSRLGNVTYKNTGLFFAINNALYSIEKDGSMYKIDLGSGAWSVVSNIGTWFNFTRAFAVANTFYAIEEGALYRHTALNPKARVQIGKTEFYEPGYLITTDSALYSLTGDGILSQIDTRSGEWKKIAKSKGWKNIRAGDVLNGKFYAVELPATLSETSLTDGTRKELDTKQFNKTIYLVADAGKLYAVTKEGNLYEVVMN
jgi:hypothetical protein